MFEGIAAWFAGKLGGIGGKLLEFIIGVLLLIILVGGPYWLGMRHQAQADLAAQRASELVAQHHVSKVEAKGQQISTHVQVSDAKAQIVYRTIIKEVPHVVTVYKPAPDAPAVPIPRAVFTRGFVSLWNCALDGLPDSACVSVADAPDADAALAPSDVDEGDILFNLTENAETCTAIRRQLIGLIEFEQAKGEK